MREAEQPGVQGLTREGGNPLARRPIASDRSPGTRAIDRIADQRMSEMGEMNPNLVRPTRSQAAFDLRRMETECALDPERLSARSPARPSRPGTWDCCCLASPGFSGRRYRFFYYVNHHLSRMLRCLQPPPKYTEKAAERFKSRTFKNNEPLIEAQLPPN